VARRPWLNDVRRFETAYWSRNVGHHSVTASEAASHPSRRETSTAQLRNPRHYIIFFCFYFAVRHTRVQLLHCKRLTVVPSTDTATLDWLDTTSIARDLGWLSWSLKLFRLLSPSISSSPPPESFKYDLVCLLCCRIRSLKHELIIIIIIIIIVVAVMFQKD